MNYSVLQSYSQVPKYGESKGGNAPLRNFVLPPLQKYEQCTHKKKVCNSEVKE